MNFNEITALLTAWQQDAMLRTENNLVARKHTVDLGIRNVQFIQSDARTADYHDGTIFFMFTPFTGQMLQVVLSRLAAEAQKRPITLCTDGTVSHDVAQQPWLQCPDPERLHAFKLCIFSCC